jgi:hypothetical protein
VAVPVDRPRVRHSVGLPWDDDRVDLPEPSVVLIEERADGAFLVRLDTDGRFGGDTWHASIDDARYQLAMEFESAGEWASIPPEVEDAAAYAMSHAAGHGPTNDFAEPTNDATLRLVTNGHAWRWTCACGTPSGRWYGSEEEALKAGRRHATRHPPPPDPND